MALERVTITGADNMTSIRRMLELSDQYPFVEWGVLVSGSAHTDRFPSDDWIHELIRANQNRVFDEKAPMNLSMHLCGSWVTQLLKGKLNIGELPALLTQVQRLQINTHAAPHTISDSAYPLLVELSKAMRDGQGTIIFQGDRVNEAFAAAALLFTPFLSTAILYDQSHGAGVLPDKWRPSSRFMHAGYAGGLGPDNLHDQLPLISLAAGSHGLTTGLEGFWIDMEGKVCTQGEGLNIPAVERVLQICEPWVKWKLGPNSTLLGGLATPNTSW